MTKRVPLHAAGERHRSAALAAVLSFFVPGLGQIYAGRVARGLLLAIPQTVVLLVLGWLFLQDPLRLGGLFLVNAMPFALLNILLLFYRAYAVIDAYLLASGGGGASPSRRGLASGGIALALLLVADVALHGYAAYASYVLDRSVNTSFPTDCLHLDPDAPRPRNCPRPTALPTSTPIPTTAPTLGAGQTATPVPTVEPGVTPSPPATPIPTLPAGTPYWAENGRLDLLLLGSDEGKGRVGIRTDTMIVASMDVATGRTAMFGVPRNVTNVPLPDTLTSPWPCRCFREMLSGMYTFVKDGVVVFADGDDDGFRALAETINETLGIELDGIVTVNLTGFVTTVDALGGVDFNVPEAVFERTYRDENGRNEVIDIKPGIQHMDGHLALAYVRSRIQDSDYGRMGRQQDFLRALRAQFTACNLLPRLPALFEAIGDAVRTDIPREEIPALIELMSRSKQPRRFELTPEKGYSSDWGDAATLAKVRDAVVQGFAPRAGGNDPAEPDASLPPPPANPC